MKRFFAGLSLVSALALALALPACDDKGTRAGDRCDTSSDCRPPLVCSNRFAEPGVLGVCVYPDAVPDAAVPAIDGAEPAVDASAPYEDAAARDTGSGPDGDTTDGS